MAAEKQEVESEAGWKVQADQSEVEDEGDRTSIEGLAILRFIGFKLTHVSPERMEGCFTVGPNSTQPFNVLEGGVTACVAETLASMGGLVASNWQRVAGIELNINHLRAVPAGNKVFAKAEPVYVGSRLQVWEVKFESQLRGGQRLFAIARVTLIVGLPNAGKAHPVNDMLRSAALASKL